MTVAVLDTTVNHLPEVLEYEYFPEVAGSKQSAQYQYLLAGCTCLAGDQFGQVGFDRPLSVGSFITMTDCGAYTYARANTFNGVGLPNVYWRDAHDELRLIRKAEYEDFSAKAGAIASVDF